MQELIYLYYGIRACFAGCRIMRIKAHIISAINSKHDKILVFLTAPPKLDVIGIGVFLPFYCKYPSLH